MTNNDREKFYERLIEKRYEEILKTITKSINTAVRKAGVK